MPRVWGGEFAVQFEGGNTPLSSCNFLRTLVIHFHLFALPPRGTCLFSLCFLRYSLLLPGFSFWPLNCYTYRA